MILAEETVRWICGIYCVDIMICFYMDMMIVRVFVLRIHFHIRMLLRIMEKMTAVIKILDLFKNI